MKQSDVVKQRRTSRNWKTGEQTDQLFKGITAASAGLILVVMAGIFVSLIWNSLPSIRQFGLGFLFSKAWNPVTQEFGALSSIYGTLMSTAIAMLLAVPLSVVIALFLVELAPPKISYVVGNAIELLAAVPSIIYGMWGLFVFAPFMSDYVQPLLSEYLGFLPLFQGPEMGIGMLTAGIVLALMILPFISSVMRDVFSMVPDVMKEAGYGMGATTWEVTKDITIRYGIQGMIGACLLGLGRAIGETMAITFVIGNSSDISLSLFEAGNSIASRLANEFAEAAEPVYMSSLMELGLVLFLMTFALQIVTQLWLKRVKRKMGGDLL
ncbi:MAG: phosphate ABC transporter permease subunit PstC [Candidatus Electrothrix sp. YB6]